MADVPVSGAREVHYEVQTLDGNRWTIDSTTRDQHEAVQEARAILRRARVGGVRVMKEIYDTGTRRASARIVFEHTFAKARKRPVIAKRMTPRPVVPAASQDEPDRPRGGSHSAEPSHGGAMRHAVAVAILLVAGALIWAASG
ncbi:MAG: hypothetical protein R3C97_12590 [Geminicoccaceae bacterium]